MTSRELMAGPPAELRFRRHVRLVPALRELWHSREVIRSLAQREFLVRYKQAVLGVAWAVLTPLALMAVFTLVFNRVAKIDTGGAPYALYAYLGLLPWTFFSTSLSQGGQSLVTNKMLLNKVYCPREVFPLASVMVAGIDMGIAVVALGGLFFVTGYAPRSTAIWVPVLLSVQVAFTFGITLVVSGVLVYLRDVRHALPIILQLGLFATPVAYGIDSVPESFRTVYATLNPLAPVIDGYRRTVLLGEQPQWDLLLFGSITTLVILLIGYKLFKHLETGFADVA